MQYKWRDRTLEFRGHRHWGHEIYLFCKWERREELKSFLNDVVGDDKWRLVDKTNAQMATGYYESLYNAYFPRERDSEIIVRFEDKDHAFRMKLMWVECDKPTSTWDETYKMMRKIALNSKYGKFDPFKTMYTQRPVSNPCDEIYLDTESSGKHLMLDYAPLKLNFAKLRAGGDSIS